MLIFYVDEFGNGGLGNKSIVAHPWFILGALGIRDVNRKSIAEAIRDAKTQCFGANWQNGKWADTEIKGRYLAHAAKRLSAGHQPLKPAGYQNMPPPAIGQLLDSMFRIYRTFSPVLYAIGVDKKQHIAVQRARAPYDAVALSYAYLQQRLALLSQHTSHAEEGILILADEQREHEDLFRSGQIRTVRTSLQAAMHNSPDINAIIAKPVWIDSSEMLVDREITQLADFMLYSVSLGMLHGNWEHPWLAKLGPNFARHWGKGGNIGAVWNAGITIYPHAYYRKVSWAQV